MQKIYLLAILLNVISQGCDESQSGNTNRDASAIRIDSPKALIDSSKSSIDTRMNKKVDTLKSVSAEEPKLVKVNLGIDVGDDGEDAVGSTVTFRIYHPALNYPNVADFANTGEIVKETYWQRVLDLKDNRLTKSDINGTKLFIAITAKGGQGHDRFKGTPNADFTFSDGSKIAVNYS